MLDRSPMVLYSYAQSGPIAENRAGARLATSGDGLLGSRVELVPTRTCDLKEKSSHEKYQQSARHWDQEQMAADGATFELSKHSLRAGFRDVGLPQFHGVPRVLSAVSTGHHRKSWWCRVRV